jgi:hypothetical protein
MDPQLLSIGLLVPTRELISCVYQLELEEDRLGSSSSVLRSRTSSDNRKKIAPDHFSGGIYREEKCQAHAGLCWLNNLLVMQAD